MTTAPEETVRALFTALGEGPGAHDAVLAFFAPDAKYHMNAWHEPKSGHAEIRAELERQSELFADLRSEVVRVLTDASHALVERLDHMSIGGKPVTLHFAAGLDFDAEGKITAWRDYFDMSEVAAKAVP